MAFIRKKGQYAYLVESYRDENGKPRHKTLAYLGHISKMEEKLAELKLEHPEWFSQEQNRPTPSAYHPYVNPWDRRRD